ncbi:hypothetical protein V1525DRAFT_359206 [Lipomyces kononenkoae]|uniref:Uncharacterized protein n=1 Tax=Lipomyces kononenkoae TaxID=34357 RepID=A0ACC3T4K9_LIPKO
MTGRGASMGFRESSTAQSGSACDPVGTTTAPDDSSTNSSVSTGARTQTVASDAMSTTSHASSHSGNGGSKLNFSVLCPTCSTSIALDLPFLALADGYETSRPASSHVGGFDDESSCSSSDYDSRDGESDAGMENNEDFAVSGRNRLRRRQARQRHRARKVLVKELQQKVDQLTKQAANAAGRATNLQGQLDRVKRKSSMLQLSSQGQGSPLSTPAPPKVSQTVPVPVITTPMRAVSASVVEPIVSKSSSTTSMKQLLQQELRQSERFTPQSQPSIMSLFSLARTVSYFPFSSAITSSPFLASSQTSLKAPSAPSSSQSTGGTSNILSTSSDSSTSSTFSSQTASASTTSLASLASSPSSSTEQIISHLQLSVQKEKGLREAAEQKCRQVSQEIEDLSQSLFEQANEMVAAERRERAKVEEQIRDAKAREEKLLERLSILEEAFSRIVRLRKELDDETSTNTGDRHMLEDRRKSVALSIEEVAANVVSAGTKE